MSPLPDRAPTGAPTSAPLCKVDSFALAASQDPHTPLHRLREEAPVSWSPAEHAWVLVRHADVARLVADRSCRVADLSAILNSLAAAAGRDFSDISAVMRVVLFLRNPPQHTQERSFLARVLGSWPLASYAPVITDIARRLLGRCRAAGEADLVTGFADLLPPFVMAHMFRMAEEDALALVALANDITQVLDRGRSLRFYQAMNAKAAGARAIMRAEVARRRRAPGEDALSQMIRLSDVEFGLDDEEISLRAFFLFLAGVETTSALVGASLRALLRHPAELARLASGGISAAEAFDELARLTSPVQQVTRYATTDMQVGGQHVAAGQRLVLMLGAANRDPAVYPEPDRLRLGRPGPGHLTFGAGLHHCIGMGLARLETIIAVQQFAQLPPPRLIGAEAQWMPHRTQRRLKCLPTAFG